MCSPVAARRTATVAVLLSAGISLSACSSSRGDAGSGSSGTSSSPVSVVASTNVYGDIAEQVAGGKVTVTSVITSASQDPHSFEATTEDELKLSKATLVIENGGGYDDFVEKMLKATETKPTMINVVNLSGKKAPPGGVLNEHVWYDFPTVTKLATTLAKDLGQADPANAATYTANAAAFNGKVAALEARLATLKQSYAGDGAAVTEPVPLYLLDAAGLVNKTPAAFSEAIEEETDVPADVLQQMLDLFTGRQVKLLAYNDQVTDPTTEKVGQAAKDNGIAIVPVTETLPEGKDYLTLMGDIVSSLEKALTG